MILEIDDKEIEVTGLAFDLQGLINFMSRDDIVFDYGVKDRKRDKTTIKNFALELIKLGDIRLNYHEEIIVAFDLPHTDEIKERKLIEKIIELGNKINESIRHTSNGEPVQWYYRPKGESVFKSNLLPKGLGCYFPEKLKFHPVWKFS